MNIPIEQHTNTEKVIRYYLSFLPPKGVASILDIGCGRTAPYQGVLRNRCERYESLDIRPGSKVSIISSVLNIPLKNHEFEWGWCSELIEHIDQKEQEQAVKEIMRVCKNCIFTYPLPRFYPSDRKNVKDSFYSDPGHVEVIIDWSKLFGLTHDIQDRTTKNGRAIFIVTLKGYIANLYDKKLFR